jgi:hypothetical protein
MPLELEVETVDSLVQVNLQGGDRIHEHRLAKTNRVLPDLPEILRH